MSEKEETARLYAVTGRFYFYDLIGREYAESYRQVTSFMDLDSANNETYARFKEVQEEYAPYIQYESSMKEDEESGCLRCVIACPMKSEPKGRRWKVIYATKRRDQLPSGNSKPQHGGKGAPYGDSGSDDEDDLKKDNDQSTPGLRKRVSQRIRRLSKAMCMGANGSRADDSMDIPANDFDITIPSQPMTQNDEIPLSDLLDRPEDMENSTGVPSYTHSQKSVDQLCESHKGSDRFLGAMLEFHCNSSRFDAITIPMLGLEDSEVEVNGTCSLGLRFTLDDPRYTPRFREIYKEKFISNIRPWIFSPLGSDTTVSLLKSGRITKKKRQSKRSRNKRASKSKTFIQSSRRDSLVSRDPICSASMPAKSSLQGATAYAYEDTVNAMDEFPPTSGKTRKYFQNKSQKQERRHSKHLQSRELEAPPYRQKAPPQPSTKHYRGSYMKKPNNTVLFRAC